MSIVNHENPRTYDASILKQAIYNVLCMTADAAPKEYEDLTDSKVANKSVESLYYWHTDDAAYTLTSGSYIGGDKKGPEYMDVVVQLKGGRYGGMSACIPFVSSTSSQDGLSKFICRYAGIDPGPCTEYTEDLMEMIDSEYAEGVEMMQAIEDEKQLILDEQRAEEVGDYEYC